MEDPTKYKQEVNKMKEYKDEIKRKERQILMIKLHLKDWSGVWFCILRYTLKNHWLIINLS